MRFIENRREGEICRNNVQDGEFYKYCESFLVIKSRRIK
jgi:hypothetical protein